MSAWQDAKFINKVLERCAVATDKAGSFTLEDIEKEFVSPDQSDEMNYWTKKHVASALSICQSIKVISSELRVRHTPNLGFPIEFRVGKITGVGRYAKKLPSILRYFILTGYLQKKNPIAIVSIILSSLAFIWLLWRAGQGFEVFKDWVASLM